MDSGPKPAHYLIASSFTGSQPSSFIYALSLAALVPQWQLNSCDRDHMIFRAWNMIQALYKKGLPTFHIKHLSQACSVNMVTLTTSTSTTTTNSITVCTIMQQSSGAGSCRGEEELGVVEHLPSMLKALGFLLNIAKNPQKNKTLNKQINKRWRKGGCKGRGAELEPPSMAPCTAQTFGAGWSPRKVLSLINFLIHKKWSYLLNGQNYMYL